MAIFKYLRVAAAALVVLHVAVAQKCCKFDSDAYPLLAPSTTDMYPQTTPTAT